MTGMEGTADNLSQLLGTTNEPEQVQRLKELVAKGNRDDTVIIIQVNHFNGSVGFGLGGSPLKPGELIDVLATALKEATARNIQGEQTDAKPDRPD